MNNKKQLTTRVKYSDYKTLKIHCLENDLKIGNVLQNIISTFLETIKLGSTKQETNIVETNNVDKSKNKTMEERMEEALRVTNVEREKLLKE